MVNFQNLSASFHKVKTLRTVQLCLSIAAVVLAAIGPTRIFGFALAMIVLVGYLFYSRRVIRAYCWDVIKANIHYGLCAGFSNVEATERNSLSEKVFDAWKMLPRRKGKGEVILSRNGFSCAVKEKNMHGAEVTVHYCTGNQDDRKSYHFISGTALWCEGDDRGDWLLLHRDWIHPRVQANFLEEQGYKEIIAGEKLEKDFLLCSRKEDAVLPEAMERELERIVEETPTLGALRLSSECNAAFLYSRFYAPKVRAVEMPTPQELGKNTLPERDTMFRILCG